MSVDLPMLSAFAPTIRPNEKVYLYNVLRVEQQHYILNFGCTYNCIFFILLQKLTLNLKHFSGCSWSLVYIYTSHLCGTGLLLLTRRLSEVFISYHSFYSCSCMSPMKTSQFLDAVWTNRSLRVWQQGCCRPLLPSWGPYGHFCQNLDKVKTCGFPPQMQRSRVLPQNPSTLVHKT